MLKLKMLSIFFLSLQNLEKFEYSVYKIYIIILFKKTF